MTVRSPISMLAALLAALAFAAAPALAAAPETPATREAKSITATSASLRGELNPRSLDLEMPEEYDFAYAQSASECTGGLLAPEPAGIALGELGEEESEPVTSLEPDRQYTFCIMAIHEGKVAYGQPLSFTTLSIAPPSIASQARRRPLKLAWKRASTRTTSPPRASFSTGRPPPTARKRRANRGP